MIRVVINASPIARSRLIGLLGRHGAFEVAEASADVDADVLLVEAESFADAGAREGFDWAVSGGPVVLLLRDFSINVVGEALRAGVKAVLPSSASELEIVAAVEAAAAGLVVMEASDVDALLRAPNWVSETGSLLEALTPREIEVLPLLASGPGNKEIAARLEISEHTVKFHVASIMGKLGATSRTEAVTLGIRRGLNQAPMFEEIVGSSEPLQKVLTQVSKVALSDSTVLILGETGTGKELIARAIHKRSKRARQPFIGVNCGAIATSLIASELFGHEKGAFTGATQRRLGRFEAANGGTILLDEVGDLPPDIQIALLRVLQEREIERVGSDKPIPIDVRVLAATHRDLDKLVSEGKFRHDLLYRLNVVPITMPSLRERASDIHVLVEYFIARFSKKGGKKFRGIDKKTLDLLRSYGWPGNIRELQNVIERAVILSDSNIFAVDAAWLKRAPSEVSHSSVALTGVLLAHEKEAIEAALAQSQGRVSGTAGAAAKLGVPDSTLDAKIKRLGINKYRFKAQIS